MKREDNSEDLRKGLGSLDLFAIAAGAMVSSGIFVLPGRAFAMAGPAVVLAYLIAGLLAFFGTLSVIELTSAMPKAGGNYFVISRALGPAVGTISGFLSWLALSLKSAFAIYGLAALVAAFTPLPLTVTALVLTAVLVGANLFGIEAAGKLEAILVIVLLLLMITFAATGFRSVDPKRFAPFVAPADPIQPDTILPVFATAAFVFVSFGGLINVTSLSEEVRRPAVTIPRAINAAVIVVTLLYGAVLFVTVGLSEPGALRVSDTPIADAAGAIAGRPGFIIVSVAAALAFVTTAHAGILSASRYPMALARDSLVPPVLAKVNEKSGVPRIAVIITGALIACSLLLDLDTLVKAASTVVLTSYVLSNLSVVTIRLGRVQNYRPSFRAPLFPYLQIVCAGLFVFLIIDLGLPGVVLSSVLLILALALYFAYGRQRNEQEYALLHLIERITSRQLTDDRLESELLDIIHDTSNLQLDRFDRLIQRSTVLDIPGTPDSGEVFRAIADSVAPSLQLPADSLVDLLTAREKESSTAISPFLAVPHIVLPGQGRFELAIARVAEGARFNAERDTVRAIFALFGSKDERTFHLQALTAIAQIVHNPEFETRWLEARSPETLRHLILLANRRRH